VLQLVPHLRIYICIGPVDFRCGLDSLGGVCRKRFDADPLSGAMFVFRNRAGTCLKIIVNDGVGGWLITRRFSRGKLVYWPSGDDTVLHPLVAHELAVILYNGDPSKADFAVPWRSVS
jgi:transposase